MDKYKPGYLGKVIPTDNQQKMTDFVTNKYDAFSKAYDTVKDQSDKISNVCTVETSNEDPNTLSIKVTTDSDTMEAIKSSIPEDDKSVSVVGDIVTAKV
jgi:hypothetical protein